MDSLTTSYLVCMLIGSVGTLAGAFLGNKVFQIESSIAEIPVVGSSVPEPSSQTPEPPLAPSQQNTEQNPPSVPSAIV